MVDLKQKENCETKRDKKSPGYIGGAKMTKIFATKALSMVLCFVMLFMGAPVTTWAVAPEQSITAKKGNTDVTSDAVLDSIDEDHNSLTLTAVGFTGVNATWEATGTGASNVKLNYAGGGAETCELTYTDAATTDVVVQVTATGVQEESETASVEVTLKALTDGTIDVYSDDAMETSVDGDVELDEDGNVTLYVKTSADGSEVTEVDVTGEVTLYGNPDEDASVTYDADSGALAVSGASDGGMLTVRAHAGGYVFTPVSFSLSLPDEVQIDYIDVWLSDDEDAAPVSKLTMDVGDEVDLTAYVETLSGDDNGVEWESSDSAVVSVEADGYEATLTAKAAGRATITVTSVDDTTVTHEIEVTVSDGLTFTAREAVYNTDLWTGADTSNYARFLKIIGFIKDGESIDFSIEHVKVLDSTGAIVAQTGEGVGIGAFLCHDWWVENATGSLREDGFVSDDELPIVFDYHYMLEALDMDDLAPGKYTVEMTTFGDVKHTSSITIVHNEVYENAEWTKGSSEGLLIAKMPNITNDLLVELISDLKILKDGTQLLKDKGNTDILEVDAETGNVYIQKAILDTLEAGTYSISFKAGTSSESFTFTVVDASDVRTLSTDVTISVGGVAKNQKIMVRDINDILSDDTRLNVEVSSDAHDELDTPVFDVEHGFHYHVKLLDSAGKELEMPLSNQVELLFECVDGLDIGQLEVVLANSLTDTQFEEDYQEYGGITYVGVLTNHFSPYYLFDKLTDEEKAALGKGNLKTGDHAVQLTVAGLGSILVLALGIMLRLISRKKKFEE